MSQNPKIAPSEVTCSLVNQLVDRDAFGQHKYGQSLDRQDLTIEEWLQHGIEEALDMAGYMAAAKREIDKLRQQLVDAQKAAREYALLRRDLEQFFRDLDRPRRYNRELTYQEGVKDTERDLRNLMVAHESGAILRQLRKS